MKRSIVSLLLICFFAATAHAQALSIDSTRFITGNSCCTVIASAIATADKGILFVGYDQHNPGGIIPYFSDTVNGNVMVGKMDSNRHLSWIKIYGGSGDDGARSAVQTPDGGYAVLCYTSSTDGDITHNIGGKDMWLLKLDSAGNLLWQHTFGSTDEEITWAIANTPDHGLILSGGSFGSDNDVPQHYGGNVGADWLVIKTDSAGNKQWSKDLGGSGAEGGGSILAINDAYYLISNSVSTDQDCVVTWHTGTDTDEDVFILKLDTAGNVLWDKSYGGTGYDLVNDALFDPRDNTIVFAGQTNSNDYMVSGVHPCFSQSDMWLVKVDLSGNLIWQSPIGSVESEYASGICINPTGGYVMHGGVSIAGCTDTTLHNIGAPDCWIFLVDNAGHPGYNQIFGGIGYEGTASVLPAGDGYAAISYSISNVFTEGTTSGRNYSGMAGAITYFNTWPLGIHTPTGKQAALSIYPNPSSGDFKIAFSNPLQGRITIINSMGRQVYTTATSAAINNLDIPSATWPTGLYLIKCSSTDGATETVKFIKE